MYAIIKSQESDSCHIEEFRCDCGTTITFKDDNDHFNVGDKIICPKCQEQYTVVQ